jgi:hypothetical protein
LTERSLTRLFYLQCLLTITFLVSDLALANQAAFILPLLQFFEVATDAVSFELQAGQFGIRRFQSLALIGGGFTYFLWARYGLPAFLTRKGIILIPVGIALLAFGMLSGHRYLFIVVIMAFGFCSYVQRLFTFRNSLVVGSAALLGMIAIYVFSERLPLAGQRAISFLPGIEVDAVASADARSTWEMRVALRRIGLELAPQYFWIGRGLGFSSTGDTFAGAARDPVMAHVNIGRFYNGIVGMLVNTGLFGTFFMLVFLTGGTIVAVRMTRLLREHRWNDHFALTCTVIVSLWMARVVGWLFLHGDSEWALRSFSLQAAMLIACHYHLCQRLESDNTSENPALAG